MTFSIKAKEKGTKLPVKYRMSMGKMILIAAAATAAVLALADVLAGVSGLELGRLIVLL